MPLALSLIILKTTPQHFEDVIKHQRHALRGRINKAREGDILLIAEMQPKGPALVRYAMRFKDQHIDGAGDSERIWGRHWNIIVNGQDGRWLATPFAPAQIKPDGPYGQGGTLVYVPLGDAREFIADGRLAPIV